MKYIVTIDNSVFEVEIENGRITVDDQQHVVEWHDVGPHTVALLIDNRSFETVVVNDRDDHVDVLLAGERHQARVQDELSYRVQQAKREAAASVGEVTLTSPMPGLIVNVLVEEGQQVSQGQTLVVLESMKMENELKSPRDGTVERVFVEAGTPVEKGQQLVTVGGDAEENE